MRYPKFYHRYIFHKWSLYRNLLCLSECAAIMTTWRLASWVSASTAKMKRVNDANARKEKESAIEGSGDPKSWNSIGNVSNTRKHPKVLVLLAFWHGTWWHFYSFYKSCVFVKGIDCISMYIYCRLYKYTNAYVYLMKTHCHCLPNLHNSFSLFRFHLVVFSFFWLRSRLVAPCSKRRATSSQVWWNRKAVLPWCGGSSFS